jgi:dTDP-4-dehydrorhamnose reductase
VVSDQVGSPTFAKDLANVVLEIIDFNESHNKRDGVELFHYSNHGFCSWYDFATEAFRILKVNCKIESITTNQLESKLERPMNSALDTEKISQKLGIVIPSWKVSLESFLLRNYKK